MKKFLKLFYSPYREYVVIALLFAALISYYVLGDVTWFLVAAALIGSLPVFIRSAMSIMERRLSIYVFNAFAIVVSFFTKEFSSVAFIALMLAFADILDWRTETRAKNAVRELLKLKPLKALVENGEKIKEINVDDIKEGDVLVVETGARVPVDGRIIFGSAYINESSVTGESMPVHKVEGDLILSSTLVESGAVKIKAANIGENSTIERMAELVKVASKNKSRAEKLADKFAAVFFPFVLLIGVAAYMFTGKIQIMVALFLVACADDIAVAIPLAIAAALGRAAKRGVIVKGGEWLESLAKIKTLVLDKTGTLTYGRLSVLDTHIEPGINEREFWRLVAIAEKFSEHPIGRAVFKEGVRRVGPVPDPDDFEVHKGSGIRARWANKEIIIGVQSIIDEKKIRFSKKMIEKFQKEERRHSETSFFVFLNKKFLGLITVTDMPREEAKTSIDKLEQIGVEKIVMFTGDNELAAKNISEVIGIKEFHSLMTPEKKLRELEELGKNGKVAMVGDGVNDAPALARADVGIAMGGGGSAVAVEAADVVILTDNLSRIPEIISLSQKTMSVIRGDIVIWFFTNLVGFTLVLTGIAGPSLAAFYNFATDFFPILNSARLFKGGKRTFKKQRS